MASDTVMSWFGQVQGHESTHKTAGKVRTC